MFSKQQLFHWWHRIALILLIIHGLVGFWESFSFMIFEYPDLSNQLSLHQIKTSQVNQLISRAIINFITTSVNILFAIRLSRVRETTAHNIDLLVATFLILTTLMIQEFLVQLDLLNTILGYFS
jgi:hypothetical protein